MNLLRRVSFSSGVSHKTFRHMLLRNAVSSAAAAGNLESEQVVGKMDLLQRRGDCVTYYNTLMSDDMSKAEELSRADRTRQVKRLSPNKTTYTSLIDSFCKQDKFDVAYRVLNQMILSGFSPSFATLNDVIRGFLRIGDMRNAFEMRQEMNRHTVLCWRIKDRWMNDDFWMDKDTKFSLYQRLSDEVTYTSLMNAYLDEGNLDYAEDLYDEMKYLHKLLDQMPPFHQLQRSVMHSVFINGLDNKSWTTEIKKYLFRFSYDESLTRPILDYHRTLAENCSHDEFKSLVELVQGFCNRGLENAYDTMLKSNYKPDGRIVYNLFVIAHSRQLYNAVQAYNMYKEMVHYGFDCHMFTVFALIKALKREDMVNEQLWVIQNVLRSCNLNDSEIDNFLNEFNPKEYYSEALSGVLAEKAKDGLFLKCSYAPATA